MNFIKVCVCFEQFKYTIFNVNNVNDCALRKICKSLNKFWKFYWKFWRFKKFNKYLEKIFTKLSIFSWLRHGLFFILCKLFWVSGGDVPPVPPVSPGDAIGTLKTQNYISMQLSLVKIKNSYCFCQCWERVLVLSTRVHVQVL